MNDHSEQILDALNEIRELVRVMAEPQIAARDQKLRKELVRIVGRSAGQQKSVFLMDGNLTQAEIHRKTGLHKGTLSEFVKRLSQSGLLLGDPKQPKLAISIPKNFFENAENE